MRHSIRLGTIILAASVGVAFALQVPSVDSATRKAAVDEIARLLETRYVSQDLGKKYGARLQAQLAAGAFDTARTPAALASLLTQELQRVNGDKHLGVFAPGPQGAQLAPPAPPKDLPVPFLRRLPVLPHGFRRVGVLDGNIGYLDLLMFVPEATGRDTAVAAMKFLGGVDALIVDLRDNGGGSPGLIRLISSYFFDKPTHLNSIYWREGNRTEEFWTYDTVDGRRLSDVPIFVLTSRRTASGGEEFTYNLKTRRRALIIGEVTWGGANPGGTFPLPAGLRIFVPVGRAINPITGTNWEGTGVMPDVESDRERAFEIGLERARIAAESHRRSRSTLLGAEADIHAGMRTPSLASGELRLGRQEFVSPCLPLLQTSSPTRGCRRCVVGGGRPPRYERRSGRSDRYDPTFMSLPCFSFSIAAARLFLFNGSGA